jgi:hypothetical protein
MTAPSLSVILPYAATNYVINGSMEAWSAGPIPTSWSNSGSATLSQSSTVPADAPYTWRGANSCKVVAADGYRGLMQAVVCANAQYRGSIYVYVVSGSIRFVLTDYSGFTNSNTIYSSNTGWQRLSITRTATDGGMRFYIQSNNVAATFYIDAVQLEDGAETTTYIDGNEPGCYWNGTPHASTSTRDGQSREGGKIVNLVGSSYLANITNMPGIGMPPFKNVSIPFGLTGGAIHQRTVKQPRVFTILGIITGTGVSNFHTKRSAIENLIKYDLVTPEQPVKLLYNNGVSFTNLTIHAVYDGGLEFNQDQNALFGSYEPVVIRFLADDPCWYSDQQSCQMLGYNQTVANANYILQRKAGIWSALKYGTDGNVQSIIYAPNGSIYVGGDFVHVGIASAGDTVVNGIAKWINGTWVNLHVGANIGVSGASPNVNAMAIGPDGSLYIGGQFSLAGAVANTVHIAKWDGTVFTPLGTGMNGSVYSMVFGPDGSLYVGGTFTTADGVACNRIAKWDGANWTALASGMNAICSCLTFGRDGYLYAGGSFTDAGTYIAKWNGSEWSNLGTGLSHDAYSMVFGPDNNLYITGIFTAAGGIACNYIAKWNGTAFSPLGVGLGYYGYFLAFAPNGNLYVAGNFSTAGGIIMPDSIVIWTGSAFIPIDVDEPGAPTTNLTICFDPIGNLYIGYKDAGSATSATVTTPTNVSTKTYPLFTIYHSNVTGASASIYQIVNYTTGRTIYFNNLQILNGETVYLQTMPGKVNLWSVYRGNLNNFILQGSNLDWYLQPGVNNVSAYLIGGTAGSMINMLWNNTYWSFSGSI